MPDPLSSGVNFASRLVQNVYGLHKEEQDKQRGDAEKSRQSMMTILEGAANSGNVNPEDMPALYSKLFELSGAKSKDIAALTPHLQSAFTQSNTPRTSTTTGPDVSIPASSMASPLPGGGTEELSAFQLPAVPQTSTVNTPAIRMMSPEEKATMSGRAQTAQLQATYPQRQKELDDANDRRLELQGAKLTAQDQTKRDAIILKGGIDAQKKFNERVNMYLPIVNGDMTAAQGLASKSLIRDEEAAVTAKEGQAKLSAARITNMQGRLAVAQQNAVTLSRRADTYAKAVEQAGTLAASGKGGAAATRNLKTFQAQTKELYAALTPLNNAIVKMEIDPANSDNGVLDPNVKAEIDKLKAQRDEIKGKLDAARATWLPSMPEPTASITPPVPQVSAPATKGIIRRGNLGAVRTQNPQYAGTTDDQLIQILAGKGYAVK